MCEGASVYALCTPTGTPFYIGATVQSVGTRAGQHLRDARSHRRSSAVHELLRETRRVGVWVLESGIDVADMGARERHWKFAMDRAGFDLLQYHHGGNGCCSQPPQVRAQIARYAATRERTATGQFVPSGGLF